MVDFQISWFGPHFGEEPPISGIKGSGTIFFCKCNLKCVYCQNWQISQENIGCRKIDGRKLSEIIFYLQEKGCHNINLVSPTIWSSGLVDILKRVKKQYLKIPIVWNCNGYETLSILEKLKGLVDIYLPDFKYADNILAKKYSGIENYSKIAEEAIMEMQNQVGDLRVDKGGIAKSGIIVRHLVLPGCLKNTKDCLKFIRLISPNVHLSLMSQYNPTYMASRFTEINRTLSREEYHQVLKMVEKLEFENGWIQEFGEAAECLNPDFSREKPFGVKE